MTTKIKDIAFQFVDGLAGGNGQVYLQLKRKEEEKRKQRAEYYYEYNRSVANKVLDRVEQLAKSNRDLRKIAEYDELREILTMLSKRTALQVYNKCKREYTLLKRKKVSSKFPEQCKHFGKMKALEFFIFEVCTDE